MESNRFEDGFRNAFAGAEVLPSTTVWTNIELDLEKASGGKLKRNLLMFQLLAAASVAFAFGIAALYYLDQPVKKETSGKESLSQQEVSSSRNSSTKAPDQKLISGVSDRPRSTKKSDDASNHVASGRSEKIIPDQSAGDQYIKDKSENHFIEGRIVRSDLSAFIKTNKPQLHLPKEEEPVEPDAGMVLLAKLKDEEKKYRDDEKKTSGSAEKVWASLGFGAGSYKPNVQSSAANLNAATTGASSSQASVNGNSYSVGMNVAGKLSKRVVLQGGISYLAQNADFTSTYANQGVASLNEFIKVSDYDFSPQTPYTVNSNMQFVSIPVQAGYLVVDRAFGLQLNGGISTDLFINNTLTPASGDYQKVTQAAGKDSPYRTVNFSGLLGTEFSYRIASHYRISLNPGLRYSLHSIYKEEVAGEITPVTVDVSLRFRYIFK